MQASRATAAGQDGEDLEGVVDVVLGASRALVAVAARSIAEVDETVTLPQFRTLVALAARGPQNVGLLAAELGVHSSTMTRMCDRLARRGLIERLPSTESRREVVVSLSGAGVRLMHAVTAARRRSIAQIVANISPDSRRAMVDALQAFSDAAGEVTDQAWAIGWGRG